MTKNDIITEDYDDEEVLADADVKTGKLTFTDEIAGDVSDDDVLTPPGR